MKKAFLILLFAPLLLMGCTSNEIDEDHTFSSDPTEENLDRAIEALEDLEELGIE